MPKITAKRVSNYELFYDLVFVLATSRYNKQGFSFGHNQWLAYLLTLLLGLVLLYLARQQLILLALSQLLLSYSMNRIGLYFRMKNQKNQAN